MADKQKIADNIVQAMLVLDHHVAQAEAAGLEVTLGSTYDGKRWKNTVRVYEKKETTIAESPERKTKGKK